MKIIFFARRFYPQIGGVEKHVLEVGKRLTAKGHSVLVITEKHEGLSIEDEVQGIKIYRINSGKEGKLKKFRIWFQLLKHINKIADSDVVHCHDIFFWYLPFRFIFPFMKVFITFHGYEANEVPHRKSILMHKIAEKLSYGNICVGSFYKKWYGTNATVTTYGAVDPLSKKNRKSSFKSRKEIIFVGRLEEETGIMEYLKALDIFDQNLKIDIFGNGTQEKKGKKYIVDNNINARFYGFVLDAANRMQDYKIVFVSRYLGILEAMVTRKPVFAIYNNAIKKDYLEMTPFAKNISISKNAEELAKNLVLFKNHESNINIDKAFEWVENQTWEKLTQQYLSLWNYKD